jgi:hypothetical protein
LSTRSANIVGVLILLAAAALRLAGVNDQLWLDEIWSIRMAQAAATPVGVFTNPTLHHDNNHWLNTLYLQRLGPGRPWWTYHLLAEATGIGTVLIGWLLARRRGEWEGLAALVLLGAAEFLIEYSAEARGYAPAGFFALLCAWLLERHLEQPKRWTAALMAASAVAGILSHLTFVVILAGLIASSAIAVARRRGWKSVPAFTLIWWAVPVATIALLYFVSVRHMIVGGGPPTASDLAAQAAAMTLGIPVGSVAAPIIGTVAVLLCAWRIRRLYRAADPLWPLMLAALIFAVGVLLFWPRTDFIHPRYIYLAVPLLLTALGMELGSWLSGRPPARFLAAIAIAGFVIVNACTLTPFLRIGRGDYENALRYMIDHTTGPVVVIGTDDRPTPTMMVLQYDDQYHVHSPKPLFTINADHWGNQWPQWMVTERDLGENVTDPDGIPFIRRAEYPKASVSSGIPWTIYEAQAAAPNVSPDNLRPLSQ